MVVGINYPWTVFDGRANYGCDFGRNRWGSHTGVTAHAGEVRADFALMGAAGIEVARWFLFTDGRGGLAWTPGGELAGVDGALFDDVDAAVEMAGESGMRLCLVVIDFLWLDEPWRRAVLLDDNGESAFLDRVFDPLLDRYARSAAIHSFDAINEPDWVTDGLGTDPARAVWPLERLRAFVGDLSARVHAASAALVTVGGARVAAAAEWDRPEYGLDFVQVHSYPDVRYPFRDDSVFGKAAADFRLSKPLLIGECPADPRANPPGHLSPSYSLEDYLTLARDGGYLGAWPWSFKGVDAFGAVDVARIAAWRHSRAAP